MLTQELIAAFSAATRVASSIRSKISTFGS
jgi:hypothetical protein